MAAPRDAAALVALFALSVAARAPFLQLVPRFTDEVRRIIWSLRILDGDFWPLVYKNGYNGALMIYVNAAALAVAPGPATPRWTAALVASIAPPALYLLGRELHGSLAGALAGLLMATSFVPVVVFGHLPWAITLTATLSVIGLWLVARAVRLRSAPALLAGAAALGLAVQTHPLAVILLPGLVAWLVAGARSSRWPGRRPALAGAMVFALALVPFVIHHAPSLLAMGRIEMTWTADMRAGGPSLATYPAAVAGLLAGVVDALSAADHGPERPPALDAFAWLCAGLAVLGVSLTAWRGPRLPAAVTIGGLALMPVLVQTHGFPLGLRYAGLLLPAIYLSIGCALASACSRSRRWAPAWACGAIAIGLVVFLAAMSTARIRAHYAGELAAGRTNHAILALAETARDAWVGQGPGAPAVVVDDAIEASYPASGNISRVLEMLLGLHGVPIAKVSAPDELDEALGDSNVPRVVIVSEAMRAAADSGDGLDAVAGSQIPAGADGDGFGLFRWSGDGPER